ncbi:MAG: hypothetical protein ABW187_02395 [Dokdonella sp.]
MSPGAAAARIALVTAAAARDLDDDLGPRAAALDAAGLAFDIVAWDDRAVDWSRYALAVLRSTWDYTQRLPEFLAWLTQTATQTELLNPLEVVRWNTDKHYLAALERAGVAIVPSAFAEAGEDAGAALAGFLETYAQARELVVKPAVGAGSRDARRHAREDRTATLDHLDALLCSGRSAVLQPYLERVDAQGETALIYVDGVFSHAIRKGPLLRRGDGPTDALFAAEDITPRLASEAERALAQRAVAAIPFAAPLAYARVDLIHDADGMPRLLELELAEPSLFFAHGEGSALRFARILVTRATR